jgi:hypothetical protein
LVQLVVDGQSPAGEMDYDDGRILWPWRQCDLLIIDDVDVGASQPSDNTPATPFHLVQPQDLVDALTTDGNPEPLEWLGHRRSVWVVGDPSNTVAWRRAIAGLMDVEEEEIMTVEPARMETKPLELTTMGRARRVAAEAIFKLGAMPYNIVERSMRAFGKEVVPRILRILDRDPPPTVRQPHRRCTPCEARSG